MDRTGKTEAQLMIETDHRRMKAAYLEGWTSIVINTIFFVLKYWAGLTSGSVAVIADAWHTLSDSLTSLIVLIGAKMSKKSADEAHPFGHGRAEVIASIVIGVLLAVVGINFLIEAVNKLRSHEAADYNTFVVFVFGLSFLVKEGLAQFSIRMGKSTESKVLMADGWHHRSDALASAIILIGVFINDYFWWIDGVLGILVALQILYATFKILMNSIDPLLGEKPDDGLVRNLHSIACEIIDEEFDLHHIHIHRYGTSTELTFHIRFLCHTSFRKAHICATCMERQLKQDFNIDATIHIEPAEKPLW